jgi:predicted nucleotidyltransferase
MSGATKLPGATVHQGSTAGLDTLTEVLGEAVCALDRAKVDYLLIGGLASAVIGRPRCSSDIDLLVTPEAAPRALDVLEQAGFQTERINPHWLYKAFRRDVLVDLLFKVRGDIYLDDEMLRRSAIRDFRGMPIRVIAPEDLIVMKVIVHDEETPRHWGDALGILAKTALDWDYLLTRAQWAPRRTLSFLLYATSVDLHVPSGVVRRLAQRVLA